MPAYSVSPISGIGEVRTGDDLASLVAPHVEDGDIVVVTSKIVSKAEGRVVRIDKDAAVDEETVREVARRGPTRIVRNRLGLVMAAAGVDASNTEPGTVVLLPLDPDDSARRIREALRATPARANVAVVISDTSGRAWRDGQTDIAIGVAGMSPADSHAGLTDAYGNALAVTLPATADEIAGAAEVAAGKLTGVPLVVVRGLRARVLPAGEHGPGAVSLLRPEASDLFGLGAREAVMAALAGVTTGFGAPASARDLVDALGRLGVTAHVDGSRITAPRHPIAIAVAAAHGWVAAVNPDATTDDSPSVAIFQPASP